MDRTPDCGELMDEYSLYDEKIVRGFIVQVYYYARTAREMCAIDEELNHLAIGIPVITWCSEDIGRSEWQNGWKWNSQ
jgi:hypothetical protein